MKVIGIIGSPRVDGGASTLVNQVLEGAAESGHPTEEYCLNGMSFSGCRSCSYCKSHDRCRQDDDMPDLMGRLKVADALCSVRRCITGSSPRSSSHSSIGHTCSSARTAGSMAPGNKAVVTSQGYSGVESFSGVFADFDKLLRTYGLEKAGEMHVTNDRSPAAAISNKELMEEARAIDKGGEPVPTVRKGAAGCPFLDDLPSNRAFQGDPVSYGHY